MDELKSPEEAFRQAIRSPDVMSELAKILAEALIAERSVVT